MHWEIRGNYGQRLFCCFFGLPRGIAFKRLPDLFSRFFINDSSPQGRPVIEPCLICCIIAVSSLARRNLGLFRISFSKRQLLDTTSGAASICSLGLSA